MFEGKVEAKAKGKKKEKEKTLDAVGGIRDDTMDW